MKCDGQWMREIYFLSLGKRHFVSHISLLCAWKIDHPVYISAFVLINGMTTLLISSEN